MGQGLPRVWEKYRFVAQQGGWSRRSVRKAGVYFYFESNNLKGSVQARLKENPADAFPGGAIPWIDVDELVDSEDGGRVGYRFRVKTAKSLVLPMSMRAGILGSEETFMDDPKRSCFPLGHALQVFRGKECSLLVSTQDTRFLRRLRSIP